VVLVDGDLVLYLERGGKTLLAWPQADGEDWSGDTRLAAAVTALAEAARSGRTGPLAVERVNDASALSTPLGALLEAAGFRVTHKGYRFRS
jgi:ATP-dependent Lhr-like helicase